VAALAQFGEVEAVLWVLAVFAVGQTLEGMWLTPRLIGQRIGLHPVAVIFAVLAGGQLFGFLGVMLALPLASVVMVLVRHIHDLYKESDLYGVSAEEAERDGP
jgi:predicted PurR-regulated permease PerM